MTELETVGWDFGENETIPQLYRAVGCQACGKTGYLGRFAVHEVLLISEEIERLIVEHGHSEDIKKVAIAQGMLTLRQAGLTQVGAGITTIEEVLRVIV
jgi:type IV pilus assembly protein PilB